MSVATRPLQPHYDYVIVGGGSAGCVLARRLAEDPGTTVLLVEAGVADEGIQALLSAGGWAGLLGGDFDWRLAYEPTEKVLGRSIPIPRGKVLGGSSSINAMLWYRGNRDDYDLWEKGGATGWNYDTLLPYFKKSEDWQEGETSFRGAGGPIRVETSKNPHPTATAMIDAAGELGVPVIDDANAEDNEGATLNNLNVITEEDGTVTRFSASRGYLWPALGWPNLTVLTESSAVSLVFDGNRATGVTHLVDGHPVTTTADRGVVLTLGAIHTPELLLRSGIGDPDELAALGIPAHTGLRGVGKNFQDHPLVMGVNFRAKAPLGPVLDNGGGAMINWRSSQAGVGPDLHAFMGQGPRGSTRIQADYDLSGDVFAIGPGLMKSRSVGHVSLRSANPADGLEIQPNYLAEPEDLQALVDSLDFVLDLAETAAYRELTTGPIAPLGRLDHAGKVDFVRRACDTFFHCSGSAKMGTDEMAVVDPSLAVRGIDGLWVADASVIPLIPTCNTQAPVIAIAERAADLIRSAS